MGTDISLKNLGVARLPLLGPDIPILLYMWIIEIVNKPGLILTPSINITQINRVILSPIALVINVILRRVSVVEF